MGELDFAGFDIGPRLASKTVNGLMSRTGVN